MLHLESIPCAAAAPSGVETGWHFVYPPSSALRPWDWSKGAPPVGSLRPVRSTASGSMSRHIPVLAHCRTSGGHLELESGLEHDLVRRLDRDPVVDQLVAQPVVLVWPDGRRHVPDLLSRSTDGSVTLWDCRPLERTDEIFEEVCDRTLGACEQVGWHYEVFTGLSEVQRLNLLWLHSSRRRPRWTDHCRPVLRKLIGEGPVAVDRVLACDDGDGLLVAVLWHLVWSGELVMDLDQPITGGSLVGWGVGHG